jgi:hypothetical protein
VRLTKCSITGKPARGGSAQASGQLVCLFVFSLFLIVCLFLILGLNMNLVVCIAWYDWSSMNPYYEIRIWFRFGYSTWSFPWIRTRKTLQSKSCALTHAHAVGGASTTWVVHPCKRRRALTRTCTHRLRKCIFTHAFTALRQHFLAQQHLDQPSVFQRMTRRFPHESSLAVSKVLHGEPHWLGALPDAGLGPGAVSGIARVCHWRRAWMRLRRTLCPAHDVFNLARGV